MHGQSSVSDSAVRRNVSTGLENREEGGRPAARDIAQWRTLEHLGRPGTPSQVGRLRYALIPQEIRTPRARLVQLLPAIERHTLFGIRNIGLEPSPIGNEHRGELRTDVICGSFDSVQPGK